MAFRKFLQKKSSKKSTSSDSFNITSDLFDRACIPQCTDTFANELSFDYRNADLSEMCSLQQETVCSSDGEVPTSNNAPAMERAISSTVEDFFHLQHTPNKLGMQQHDDLGPRYPCDGQEDSPKHTCPKTPQQPAHRSKYSHKSIAKKLKLFHKQSKSASSSLKTLAVL